MIEHMRIVKGMEHPPNACCICGGNGTNDKGEPAEAIWAPGVDIDWGGSLYICCECADIIADLRKRPPKRGFDILEQKVEELTEENDGLKKQVEHQETLLTKVREGAAAQKEIRSTRKAA